MLLKNGYLIYLIGSFVNILTIVCVKFFWNNSSLSINQLVILKTFFIVILLTPSNIKNFLKVRKKDILLLVIISILATLDTYLWYLGFLKVPVNNAMILLSLGPIITSMVAFLILKERISGYLITSGILGFFSVLLVYTAVSDKLNIGYLYLLFDLIIYAFIAIIIKKLFHYSSNFLVYIRMISILVFSLINIGDITYYVGGALKCNVDVLSLLFTFCISIASLIEKICFTRAYILTDVSKIQPFRFINIIFACILSFLILGEKITTSQILGCIGVFFAIIIGYKKRN